jgi:hypothetical protein
MHMPSFLNTVPLASGPNSSASKASLDYISSEGLLLSNQYSLLSNVVKRFSTNLTSKCQLISGLTPDPFECERNIIKRLYNMATMCRSSTIASLSLHRAKHYGVLCLLARWTLTKTYTTIHTLPEAATKGTIVRS